MIRHFLSRQFLGFLAVGCTAALLHWLARLLLSLWLPFSWAVALAYAVGMAVAFTLNRAYVFSRSDKPVQAQARDFVLINLALFPVVWTVAVVLEAGLKLAGMARYTEELAHAVAIALPMLASFLFYKFVAFKELQHEQQ